MKNLKYLAGVAVAAIAIASAPAQAAGTAANTQVDNVATLSYQTGNVQQGGVTSNTATFLVDRRINLSVAEVGGTATQTVGGATNQVTTFTVTNTSNAPLDFGLQGVQTGVTAPFGGTDNFDVTNIRFAIDAPGGTAGVYDPGIDTIVTYLDEIPVDATRTVYLLADVPAGRINGDIAAVQLTAIAQEGGTAGTQGAVVTQTAGSDNPNAVDTVFADAAGAAGTVGDAARDGRASARDQYNVVAAAITLQKLATVISDPFNGTTNPKAIPGAIIEYCLIARNDGAAAATNVTVTDNITGKPLTYSTGFAGGQTTGTAPNVTCDQTPTNGGDAASASFASGVFTGNIGTIPANSARTARFRVTIN